MKIKDIITETAPQGQMQDDATRAMTNTRAYPNQNMYHGSGYLHSQYLRALAGAGAGKTPDENMGDTNWAAGDPICTPYHPLENEMLDRAAKHIGDNSKRQLTNHKSQEHKSTNHKSPVPHNSGIRKKK